MSASAPHSSVVARTKADPEQLSPDAVFERLFDMFGMMADANVILEVGESAGWKLDDCIESMIKFTNDKQTTVTQATETEMRNLNLNQTSNRHHEENYSESVNDFMVDAPPPPPTPSDVRRNANSSTSIQQIFSLTAVNGAIPKSHNQNDLATTPLGIAQPTMSSLLKHDSREFTDASPAKSKQPKMSQNLTPEMADIVGHIAQGHRILVIMRGAPGSGKSHLARSLLQQAMPTDADPNIHVCSADEFFTGPSGQYQFDRSRLGEAHDYCKAKASSLASDHWSPIFVDNTNTHFWEMQPYFCMALQHNYLIRTLEPTNAWRHSAGQLARKNIHGVPKKNIETMLNNFEPVDVNYMLRTAPLQYTAKMPQMRQYPAFEYANPNPPLRNATNTYNDFNIPQPMQNHRQNNARNADQKLTPRKTIPKPSAVEKTVLEMPDPSDTFQIAAQKLQSVNNEWTAFEKERVDFWTPAQYDSTGASSAAKQTPKSVRQSVIGPPNMVELLRDTPSAERETAKKPDKSVAATTTTPATTTLLVMHKTECPNENQVFFEIRQIYPTVPPTYLWDLFKNCDGDAEWTMDILLKEEMCIQQYEADRASGALNGELYCDCDQTGEPDRSGAASEPGVVVAAHPATPSRTSKRERFLANQNNQVRRQIEESFVIGDTHYSEHTRKIRDIRRGNGLAESPTVLTATDQSDETDEGDVLFSSDAQPTSDETSEDDTKEYLEINLGRKVIDQLESLFGTQTIPFDSTVDRSQLSTNVFMPRVLAQQLYALWMESMYNQIEEQRLKTLRDDEEFARNLQVEQSQAAQLSVAKPKLHIKDVVEMECAWAEYRSQLPGDDWKGPTDLATQITQHNLNEKFPNIEEDTLRDVLVANNNRFSQTVEMLNRMMPAGVEDDANLIKTTEELLMRAKIESDKVETFQNGSTVSVGKITDPDEAKRLALSTFEECRNKAMHHTQMKAECYYKAKNSIQRGDTAVAVYYSRVANLHRTRIDHFNHQASNCIMEVHNLTQTNPDILDLHYLYLTEAIECLDLFVDDHLNRLRLAPQPYKSLLVITGRGLHSSGGFSTIKQHTKLRLKKRGLTWCEVNPGLLRFKIFPNSPMSKDV